tara:strand:- start:127 stop:330 length:204 start_codon:yes stop_codon:yes gene_type:complete
MSSHLKEENINNSEKRFHFEDKSSQKVNLTDLMYRLKEEKKQEKKSNILISAAAISAVTVFGIILTL